MKGLVIGFLVTCALGSVPVAYSVRISQAANPCPPDFTGNVPNPEDCKSFYICNNGFPALFPCPGNLCYDPSSNACDQCSLIPGCDGSSTTVPPTTTQEPETTTTPEPTTPEPETTTTEATTTTTKEPDTTTTEDPETTTTEEPEVTTTPEPETTTTRQPDTTTTEEPETTTPGDQLPCPPDVEFIYMSYPGDCNKFYYCRDGVNTGVYNCGVGLWFNFRQQACVRPWGDNCDA